MANTRVEPQAIGRAGSGGHELVSGLFGLLLISEAAACVFFSIAHLGGTIPLGFATLQEPRILPATVAEALCGLFLSVAGAALLTRRARAWSLAVWALGFSLGGFILGLVSTLRGAGASDPANDDFHRVMLGVLMLGLLYAVAWRRRARRDQRVHPPDAS